MLPRADMNGTRATVPVERTSALADSTNPRQETVHRLMQIGLGRAIPASVQSRFDDGTFLVRVADAAARMHLPAGTQVGDKLMLTMLAHVPRPTFLLQPPAGSAPATLSATGRLIDALLQAGPNNGTTPVAGRLPLLPSAASLATAAGSAQLAGSLTGTIASSGLFYESHLHDWVVGTRTIADLANEPQAQLLRDSAAQQVLAQTQFAQWRRQLQGAGSKDDALADFLQNASLLSGDPALIDADLIAQQVRGGDALSAEAMQLIRQQLNTLEQRQIFWQGELFPGMPIEWEISDQTPGGETGPQERAWQSTMRFHLPSLGCVAATITLVGEHVQIRVGTASEEATAALREHGPQLADALQASGATLDGLLIKQDAQT